MSDVSLPPPPVAQPVTDRRPVGTPKSIGTTILLSIVTLGIYTFFWVYKQHDEIKRYLGDGLGGGIGLLLYVVVSPATWFLIPDEVKKLYEADGRESPVRATLGLWILLPIIGAFIWYPKVQGALNDFWVAKGAEPA